MKPFWLSIVICVLALACPPLALLVLFLVES